MNCPLNRNQDIQLEITALGSQAQGIGRVDGFTVFVPGALIGEQVDAHIIKPEKNYAVGKLTSVVRPSPDRCEPRCPVYDRCGGCSLQHMSYEAQLKFKRQTVYDALKRLGGVSEPNVLPTLGMDEPWRCRNKGAFPFAQIEGKVCPGLYARRSHRLVKTADCLIQHQSIVSAVLAVSEWANDNGVSAYNEETHTGTLRHAVARTAQSGVMAVVVTTGALPHSDKLIEVLKLRVPQLKSVIHNVNPADTNVILGNEFKCIWGEERLIDDVCGIKVKVSAASFLQVNPIQTEKLYSAALEYCALTGDEEVIDAYCGVGTISLLLARRAKHVTGVEIVEQAIADARENAAMNGITNVDFYAAAAEQRIPALLDAGLRPDVVVLDPPRKGADKALIDAVAAASPARIVYVSCDPATLARDVKLICESGYALVKAQPVDMFSQTEHVETVVLMSRDM